MVNNLFLETYTSETEYHDSGKLALPIQSFITYSIYKYCAPEEIKLQLVTTSKTIRNDTIKLSSCDSLDFVDSQELPWQVLSCIYPVILFENVVITGLCAVARHMTKYRTSAQSTKEHEEGLLSFRKSCLQAPNEASIWTKFCEVDVIKTAIELFVTANQENKHENAGMENLQEVTKNLSRFENHLRKPVRVHNVYKIARDLKKNQKPQPASDVGSEDNDNKDKKETTRVAKPRKWKSNSKKDIEIKSTVRIEDLGISHQFAEGPFLTLADLVLLPSYHLMLQALGIATTEAQLPLTVKWYNNLLEQPEMNTVKNLLNSVSNKIALLKNVPIPDIEDVSLYKRDPARHNPKKRLFTKEDDIENALSAIVDGMKLDEGVNNYNSEIDWSKIPDGANPNAGHLPDARTTRKSQQLENLTLAVLNIAKDGDLIIDFCSGSGHLGILIAYLLPKCTIILLENKEQSLLNARKRVHDMNLKNIYFFQCNVDFYIGKFDIGVALHACGIATDLVLDKCLKSNAKFVLCPCCYGSLHSTDRLTYPVSNIKFKGVSIDQYMCIGHTADQTHEDHPLAERGSLCMAIIDSDRAHLAEEFGYKVTLSRLKPLTCTPKNNLLIGIPSQIKNN